MKYPKSKLKIAYLSVDNFFDVDFPILKELNNFYDLTWYAIIPDKNSRYSTEEVQLFAKQYNIKTIINIRKGRRRHIRQFNFSQKIVNQILQNKPDIIYTEYLTDIYIAFLAILFFPRNKTIYAIHDVVSHTNFNSMMISYLSKVLRKHYSYFHLFSETQKLAFDSMYNGKQSFYAPLALKNFGDFLELRPSKVENKFLFFGSILEYKGLSFLIQAAEELIGEGISNFSITIAGKGEYWSRCAEMIQHEQNYNLRIEFIPNSDIANLFNSHHFLVLPYLDVTQSGPQMIALNYILPTIASNLDGFKEYIKNDETGFLFEAKSIESLKLAMKKSINLSQNKYNQLVENINFEKNTKYLTSNIISKYQEMFEAIVKNQEF